MPFLGIVQFPHPGPEHKVGPDGTTQWNTGRHRRKFMQGKGQYISPSGTVLNGDFTFWGEWEGESHLLTSWKASGSLPRFLVKPVFRGPGTRIAGLQNTDPYVFGDQFLYTLCKQIVPKTKSRTIMNQLLPESLILFGSTVKNEFVLDTVFVISDEVITHSRLTWREVLANEISAVYQHSTIDPMYWDSAIPDEFDFALYKGVTYSELQDKPFSFVPCKAVADEDNHRFSRPVISLPEIINPRSQQSYRGTPLNLNEIATVFNDIRRQVLDQGLCLAVQINEPLLTE